MHLTGHADATHIELAKQVLHIHAYMTNQTGATHNVYITGQTGATHI